MSTVDIETTLRDVVAGRRLLDHPYYRSWQEGALTVDDLSDYAAQYRHIEKCLPEVLAATAGQLEEGHARRLVEDNLADERSRPRPHLALFDGFADAVGAPRTAAPSPATARLLDVYRDAASAGPREALAVVGAYEAQAAEVAATKASALRVHYGLDGADTEFWDVHAEMETAHASWTLDALRTLDAPAPLVADLATRSADAWWAFLDEREATRQSA